MSSTRKNWTADLQADTRRHPGFWILVVIFFAIGAYLRFEGLNRRDFWFDESCTFIFVHDLLRWPSLQNLLIESTNLPYYVLLHAWTNITGESEWGFRSLSACAATATLPLLGWLGFQLGGRRTAALSVILAALHPLSIYYAHEARAYALWVMTLTLTLNLLIVAARKQDRRSWIIYAGAMFLCLHLHYFSIFLVPATLAVAWLTGDRRKTANTWLVVTSAIGLAFVPYFLYAVLPAGRAGGSAWVADSFEWATAIPQSLWAFLPAGGYPVHLKGLSVASRDTLIKQPPTLVMVTTALPAILTVALAGIVAIRGSDKTTKQNHQNGAALFLVACTIVPLLLPWLYSIIIRPVYLPARYDLVAWPTFVVALALLLDTAGRATIQRRLPPHTVLYASVILMLGCSLLPISRMRGPVPESTYHKARAEAVAGLAPAGSLVITFSHDWEFLAFYLEKAGFRGEVLAFPTWLNAQIGWLDNASDYGALQAGKVDQDAANLCTFLDDQLRKNTTILVLADSLALMGPSSRTDMNGPLLSRLNQPPFRVEVREPSFQIWQILIDK